MNKSRGGIGVLIGLGVLSFIPLVGALALGLASLSEIIKYNYSPSLYIYIANYWFFVFGVVIPVFFLGAIVHSLKRIKPWIKILITLLISGLIFLGMYFPLKNSIKPSIFTGTTDKMFAPACNGQPVKGVSDYRPGPGPHPIVILENNSKSIRKVPDQWMPKSLGVVELVACVGKSEKVLIETCNYESGGKIKRYQYQVTIQLIAASTGQLLKSITVQGSPPEYCPVSVQGVAGSTKEGMIVLPADMIKALSGWVSP